MPEITSKRLRQLGNELGVELYLWRIEESEEELLAQLPDRRTFVEKVANYKSEKRRKEWLATRVLFYRHEAPIATILYKPSGRPYLFKARHTQVSISHSLPYVCLLLSRKQASVDIETFSLKAFRLRNRFAQEEEFLTSTGINQERWATMLWSAKEAVYKLADKPGLQFKDEIRLIGKGENALSAMHPDGLFTYSVRFIFFEDFVLTVCFSCAPFESAARKREGNTMGR